MLPHFVSHNGRIRSRFTYSQQAARKQVLSKKRIFNIKPVIIAGTQYYYISFMVEAISSDSQITKGSYGSDRLRGCSNSTCTICSCKYYLFSPIPAHRIVKWRNSRNRQIHNARSTFIQPTNFLPLIGTCFISKVATGRMLWTPFSKAAHMVVVARKISTTTTTASGTWTKGIQSQGKTYINLYHCYKFKWNTCFRKDSILISPTSLSRQKIRLHLQKIWQWNLPELPSKLMIPTLLLVEATICYVDKLSLYFSSGFYPWDIYSTN